MLVLAKRNLKNRYGHLLFMQGGAYEARRDGKWLWIRNNIGLESLVRVSELDADFEIAEDFDAPLSN